ncbi:MAG TPA: hypothetical protein VH107_19390 [Lacipirellulaceae bacterium]|nr:hypothetical protein [Lacipirellulaceae bacterium]
MSENGAFLIRLLVIWLSCLAFSLAGAVLIKNIRHNGGRFSLKMMFVMVVGVALYAEVFGIWLRSWPPG